MNDNSPEDDLDNLAEDRLDGGEDEEKELMMPETLERKAAQPGVSPERSPGVYVRNNEAGEKNPHELDMLWANSRQFVKEDRSPVVFTAIGLIIGAILTGAVFYLLTSKPTISTGESDLVKPMAETELVPAIADPSQPKIEKPDPVNVEPSTSIPELLRPRTTAPAQKTVSSKRPVVRSGKAATYVVQSGDTLEQVARRYYGSGSPEMIQKIQRANNMDSPHRLSLGQKLVIPPASY